MPQPIAKTLILRVPLTNAAGQTATFEGTYEVPLEDLLRGSKEQIEQAYVARFAGDVCGFLVQQGVVWGTTIGQQAAEWAKPKPVLVVPGRVA